jgi:ketosteroid isomerase-like protein
MVSAEEKTTREAVERLYEAYFAGNPDGMLATMADSVNVRFLGRVDLNGIQAARDFFHANTGMLVGLDFRIRKLIVDGRFAAAVWDETATTVHGDPYENHGVDVFEVVDGQIVAVHENNDVLVHRGHFGRG